MNDVASIIESLRSQGDPKSAQSSARFFKSGPGEYGEGDKFIGVRVPALRHAVKLHRAATLDTIAQLLASEWHEIRLFAVILLSEQFKKANTADRETIYHFYLSHSHRINNWDLVDSSAHHIVGGYLADKDRSILYELADSTSLWERRIAMMATFTFIRLNQFDDTIALAEKLLFDKEDLIHKVCGWMLRDVGNRDVALLRSFLNTHIADIPRTMLRYAIEKLDSEERKHFLSL
ncbi:DNA alkylation repair protein [Enterovibrio sp. ZSDZ42]|uniref:DNA alkylation repair protein n=1 Tax=Enterovibrio gelatinilyticus TaxID=2899819 RepID=A0ABT5R4U0_9GAMM|nr:DNA alkylation repair protein [Enterovibrio sp. ZSDZ42]MDD1794860.1 DNA alkylation repair protein [Enterovibrio sp. ZSDZ42]